MCSSWEVFARVRPRTPSSALIACAGGATGTGVALDATTRGLRVALVEADDFASLERRDQVTLAHLTRGDAAGWFGEIGKERDRRNVCGLSPIYTMLEAAKPGPGTLAVYAQCPAPTGSVVSIASLVYPATSAHPPSPAP